MFLNNNVISSHQAYFAIEHDHWPQWVSTYKPILLFTAMFYGKVRFKVENRKPALVIDLSGVDVELHTSHGANSCLFVYHYSVISALVQGGVITYASRTMSLVCRGCVTGRCKQGCTLRRAEAAAALVPPPSPPPPARHLNKSIGYDCSPLCECDFWARTKWPLLIA